MSSILFTVMILFFLLMTLREWLMILRDHPVFVLAVLVLGGTYAFYTTPILGQVVKAAGVIVAAVLIVLFIAACIESGEEEMDKD